MTYARYRVASSQRSADTKTRCACSCSYASHPDYGWDRVCEQRFGSHPAQVLFEWNTAAHVQDNEQSPAKRAFTKNELQDFFDHADDKVTLIAASARKGWITASANR